VNEGASKTITLSFSDPDGTAPYTVTITQQPAHGSVSGSGTSFTYSADAGYTGSDSFKWKVADTKGAVSNVATVTVTVQGNEPPVAKDASVSVKQGSSVNISLSYTDPGGPTPYAFTITQQPSNGSLGGSGGTRTYTPDKTFSGTDTFKWKVTDGKGATSDVATVTITVAQNQVPTAHNGSEKVVEGGTVDVQLTYVDSDGPGPYTFTITQDPQHGTLSGTGAVRTYEPDSGYSGQDSFKWKVTDGLNDSAAATVTIQVEGDSDGDGLPDTWERQYGLNPDSDDSDGDGIKDGEEDEDFDGKTNLEEYARGTHPFESEGGSSVGMMSCAAETANRPPLFVAIFAVLLLLGCNRCAGRFRRI
jgi:hypothetical protein